MWGFESQNECCPACDGIDNGYTCIHRRDRWTSCGIPHEIVGWDGQRDTLEGWTFHGLSHDPMGLRDGMDILQHLWTPMQQLEGE